MKCSFIQKYCSSMALISRNDLWFSCPFPLTSNHSFFAFFIGCTIMFFARCSRINLIQSFQELHVGLIVASQRTMLLWFPYKMENAWLPIDIWFLISFPIAKKSINNLASLTSWWGNIFEKFNRTVQTEYSITADLVRLCAVLMLKFDQSLQFILRRGNHHYPKLSGRHDFPEFPRALACIFLKVFLTLEHLHLSESRQLHQIKS